MIETLFLGTVTLKIDGFDTSALSEKLRSICKVISLYTKSDSIYITTYGTQERRVRSFCDTQNLVCERIYCKGIIFTIKKYAKRYGVYFGAAMAAILIFFLSNTVMKIEINGISDETVRTEIREILAEEGLKAGAYIPSLNYMELSSKLFARSDNVAWASIGNNGSVVVVNVSAPTDKVETESQRIPCNIVSSRDAVIVDAQVRVGQLDVLIGDAVYKGQMLVSGILERENLPPKYVHAYADIVGRYDETLEFSQKYCDETVVYGEKIYRKSLKFFELAIPMPGKMLNSDSEYSIRSSTIPVKLLGFTLPISVTTDEYTEFWRETAEYTKEEALSKAYMKMKNYEENIRKNIVARDIEEVYSEEGATLRVRYTVEGSVGEISEIFVK